MQAITSPRSKYMIPAGLITKGRESQLGDNCFQIFHLGRYIVGYMVGNFVISGAVNHNFQPLLSDDENFEYGGYPHSSAPLNCYTLKQYISCVSDVNSIR